MSCLKIVFSVFAEREITCYPKNFAQLARKECVYERILLSQFDSLHTHTCILTHISVMPEIISDRRIYMYVMFAYAWKIYATDDTKKILIATAAADAVAAVAARKKYTTHTTYEWTRTLITGFTKFICLFRISQNLPTLNTRKIIQSWISISWHLLSLSHLLLHDFVRLHIVQYNAVYTLTYANYYLRSMLPTFIIMLRTWS